MQISLFKPQEPLLLTRPQTARLPKETIVVGNQVQFGTGELLEKMPVEALPRSLYPKAQESLNMIQSRLRDKDAALAVLKATQARLEERAKPADTLGQWTDTILKPIAHKNHQAYANLVKEGITLLLAGDLPEMKAKIDALHREKAQLQQTLHEAATQRKYFHALRQKLQDPTHLSEEDLSAIAQGMNTPYREVADAHHQLLTELQTVPNAYSQLQPCVAESLREAFTNKMREGVTRLGCLTTDKHPPPVRLDALNKLFHVEKHV